MTRQRKFFNLQRDPETDLLILQLKELYSLRGQRRPATSVLIRRALRVLYRELMKDKPA